MNPDAALAKLKTLTAAFSRGQLISLVLAFVTVVGLVGGSAYWLNRPTYRLLFSDMDPEAAAQVVERLQGLNVAYELDGGGRSVRVPADRVDELRLQFSADGLPSSGRIGFEIFDRTAFGQTEFLEQVNYRRALEGEIARTIATLDEVAGARVHIAMAKESLFATRAQPAKASVVLKLRASRPPSASTVQSVAGLVAASVEGLKPEAVVIIDSFGRPLSRTPGAEDEEPLGAPQLERQQRLERDLGARVVQLLEPIVGIDRVRVNVSARLNPESEERTEEQWDPTSAVVRSRQVTTDGTTAPAVTPAIAGVRANMPAAVDEDAAEGEDAEAAAAAAAPPAVPVATSVSRGSETTNYEISKVVRHTVRPRGDVARLSVAVILDHADELTTNAEGESVRTTKPREAAELQKLHGLVAAAVGFDAGRGDQLTVESIAFDETPIEMPEPPAWWERYAPQLLELARVGAVALLALLAFLMVVRPLMRRALGNPALPAPAAVAHQQLPRTVHDLEGEIAAQLDAAVTDRRKAPVLAKRLGTLTANEPESAARVLRTWMTEGR